MAINIVHLPQALALAEAGLLGGQEDLRRFEVDRALQEEQLRQRERMQAQEILARGVQQQRALAVGAALRQQETQQELAARLALEQMRLPFQREMAMDELEAKRQLARIELEKSRDIQDRMREIARAEQEGIDTRAQASINANKDAAVEKIKSDLRQGISGTIGQIASRFKANDPGSQAIPDYLRKIFDEYRQMDSDPQLTPGKWIDGASQILGRLQGELEKLPPPITPEQEFGNETIDGYTDKNGEFVPFKDSEGRPYKMQRRPSRNGEPGTWELVPDPDSAIREAKAEAAAAQDAAAKAAEDKLRRERERGMTLEDAKTLSETLKNAGIVAPEPPDLSSDDEAKNTAEQNRYDAQWKVYEDSVNRMRKAFGLPEPAKQLRVPEAEMKRIMSLSGEELKKSLALHMSQLTPTQQAAVMARGRAVYNATIEAGGSEEDATRQATEAILAAINAVPLGTQ